MKLQRFAVIAAALILAPALVAPALAQGGPPHRHARRGWEFNPYLVFNKFDDATELDDEVGAGFRFGYLYTPHHEIEFLLDGASTTGTVRDLSGNVLGFSDVDLTNVQVAYVYNFTKRDVVPYLTAGFGFLDTDDAALGDESDLVLGLGVGARFFLGRAFYARFEWRQNFFEGNLPVYAQNEDFSNTQLAFGVGWRLAAP